MGNTPTAKISIYSNTRYPETAHEIESNVEVFRYSDGKIRLSINTKYGETHSDCVCYLEEDQAHQLTESLVDTSTGGILDMNVDIAEKYKHDKTKCPHYSDDGCRLPSGYSCGRRNDFGYCSSAWAWE